MPIFKNWRVSVINITETVNVCCFLVSEFRRYFTHSEAMTSSNMKIKERMSLPDENAIQTDNGELHMALINYAITSSRLLFIQDLHVFADFHASDEAFNDLTTLELSAIFLGEILPNINSYPLTSRMKERLKLLDLNPCIRKTAQGYRYVPLDAAAQFSLKPKCDFSMAEQFPELLVRYSRAF